MAMPSTSAAPRVSRVMSRRRFIGITSFASFVFVTGALIRKGRDLLERQRSVAQAYEAEPRWALELRDDRCFERGVVAFGAAAVAEGALHLEGVGVQRGRGAGDDHRGVRHF